MKLIQLTLTNFNGVSSFTFKPNGKNTTIKGANGAGKTTVANAWSWLLFGKPLTDVKNFSPKKRDGDGNTVHHLNNIVEAIIEYKSELYKLKKEHVEKWTRKRGAETEEMTGESDNYYINDLPTKAKEFNALIEEMTGGPEIARMLTTFDYFPSVLHWQKRRQILFEVFGNLSDQEIIQGDEELHELSTILDHEFQTSIEDLIKAKKAEASEINKRLEIVPSLINEAQIAMPDVKGLNEASLKISKGNLDKKIAELQDRLASLKEKSPKDIADRQINELEVRMKDIEARLDKDNKMAQFDLEVALGKAEQSKLETERAFQLAKELFGGSKKKLESMMEESKKLKAQIAEEKAKQFEEGSTVCPTCGQALPFDQVETLREQFNQQKAQTIENITKIGKQNYSKRQFEEARNLIIQHETKARSLKASLIEKEKVLQKAQHDMQSWTPKVLEDNSEYQMLKKQCEEILHNCEFGTERTLIAQIEGAETLLKQCYDQREGIEQSFAKLAMVDRQNERIAQLEEERKTLSKQYAQTMKIVNLCEKFMITKSDMITSRVNDRFENIKFRLFERQINGGIKECCDVMTPTPEGALIPFAFTNTASKYNAGLEVIQVLSKYYKHVLPVFIDNAESVTHLREVDNQVIRLVVDDGCKELMVES